MPFLYSGRVGVRSLHFCTDYFYPFLVILSIFFFFGSQCYRLTYTYPCHFSVKVFGNQKPNVN